MRKCNHIHGDYVSGYWLCGQCFEKMAERPCFVYMEGVRGADGVPKSRQSVWHSSIKLSEGTTSLSVFIKSIAAYIVKKAGWSRQDAIDYAIDLVKGYDVEFGDKEFDWSEMGAREMIKEDMEYWDKDYGNG